MKFARRLLCLCCFFLFSFGVCFCQVDTAAVGRMVDSLSGAAVKYYEAGKFGEAIKTLDSAFLLAEKHLPLEDRRYTRLLTRKGRCYYLWGNYKKSEFYFLRVKELYEKGNQRDSARYATILNDLGNVYKENGQLDTAKQCYESGMQILEKTLGKGHREYAVLVDNLATLHLKKGDYDQAERLHLESLETLSKTVGTESPDYARNLFNLANVYREKGDYDKAEQLHVKALKIRENTIGKEHPDYANSLNNLANVYFYKGDYNKAEHLFLDALDMKGKALNKLTYAKSLHNLAMVYSAKSEFGKAEQLYLEAMEIRGKTIGKEHPDYARSLNNLASVYAKKKDFEKAERLYLGAREIREKSVGKEHPAYATSLFNLSNIYRDKGDYAKAKPLQEEALKIREKTLGKEHPEYATSLINLAKIHLAEGNFDTASQCLRQASSVIQNFLQKSIAQDTERELMNYMAQPLFAQFDDLVFSFLRAHPIDALVFSANNNALANANAIRDALFYRENAISRADKSIQNIHAQWKACQIQMNKWYSKSKKQRDSTTVADLETRSEQHEKELARRSPEFVEARRVVNWQEVQAKLKPAEAAIEFVSFRYYNQKSKPTDSTLYAALILLPGDTMPKFTPLFEEKQLENYLKSQKDSNDANAEIKNIYAHAPGAGNSLYDLIWKPIEPVLRGAKKIYFSPAGLLHRLNLAAINYEKNRKTIADNYDLSLRGSTRSLVVPSPTAPGARDFVVFGDAQFDLDANAAGFVGGSRSPESRGLQYVFEADSTVQRTFWKPLPGTAKEAAAIESLCKKHKIPVQVFRGADAREEHLKRICSNFDTIGGQLVKTVSPRVLHVATHGFFYPDPKTETKGSGLDGEPIFKISDDPMWRGGLILAGGNHAWQTGKSLKPGMDDGILAAAEVANLNLRNTELVVLSACETGLGDLSSGNEGVYGLQRAFKIAGARYLIMSLWKVPDGETSEMMAVFYEKWLDEGLDIPAAFRAAQAAMRLKFPDEPRKWAGFVLIE